MGDFEDEKQYIINYRASGAYTVHYKHREKCFREQRGVVPT